MRKKVSLVYTALQAQLESSLKVHWNAKNGSIACGLGVMSIGIMNVKLQNVSEQTSMIIHNKKNMSLFLCIVLTYWQLKMSRSAFQHILTSCSQVENGELAQLGMNKTIPHPF